MMTFRNNRLRDFAVPMSTNWLLNDLAEAKGKQELYTRQAPQLLKALRETALVQSVESSNRIEGVTVAADRLRRLLKEMKTTGQVICIGRGPGAKWQKRKEGHIPKRGS
jgi:Fic family protein